MLRPDPEDRPDATEAGRPLGDQECDQDCDQVIELADHHLVFVTVRRTGRGRIDLRAAATTAADRAAGILSRGPVPHRAAALPRASLGTLDACAPPSPAALARAGAGPPDPGFARWDCRWPGRNGEIRLRLDRNQPLTSADGRPVRLAGHAAYLTPGGDGRDTCLVQVVHRTYTDSAADPTAEIVSMVVSGDGPADRLCADARSLAADAAGRLPAA